MFIDSPAESRSKAAATWAMDLLKEAISAADPARNDAAFTSMLADLRRGREPANLVWDAYCDNSLFGQRLRLSELLARDTGKGRDARPLDKKEKEEVETLIAYFKVSDVRKANPSCGDRYVDLRHPSFDLAARRRAVLLVLVRLLYARFHAVMIRQAMRGQRGLDSARETPLNTRDVYYQAASAAAGVPEPPTQPSV